MPKKRMPFTVGNRTFKTKKEALEVLKQLKESYLVDRIIDSQDPQFELLLGFVKRHHSSNYFLDKGIVGFTSKYNPKYPETGRTIYCIYESADPDTICWKKCVSGEKSSYRSELASALRNSIIDQIEHYKHSNNCTVCAICNKEIIDGLQIDHKTQFRVLVDHFVGLYIDDLPEGFDTSNDQIDFLPEDNDFKTTWQEFHRTYAILQPTHAKCNIEKNSDVILNYIDSLKHNDMFPGITNETSGKHMHSVIVEFEKLGWNFDFTLTELIPIAQIATDIRNNWDNDIDKRFLIYSESAAGRTIDRYQHSLTTKGFIIERKLGTVIIHFP